jgi:hypothetical protein
LTVPSASDEEIRRLAREILLEPEFAKWRRQSYEHLEKLFGEWLRWIASFLSGTADVSLAAYVLFWSVVGALLFLITRSAVRTIRAARAPRADVVRPSGGSPCVDFAREAESLARDGRYLEAAHRLHLACIEALLRRKVLHLARFEPNRTLRARLRASTLPAADSRELCELLDRMESSWFRTREADESLYQAWRAAYVRIDGSGA